MLFQWEIIRYPGRKRKQDQNPHLFSFSRPTLLWPNCCSATSLQPTTAFSVGISPPPQHQTHQVKPSISSSPPAQQLPASEACCYKIRRGEKFLSQTPALQQRSSAAIFTCEPRFQHCLLPFTKTQLAHFYPPGRFIHTELPPAHPPPPSCPTNADQLLQLPRPLHRYASLLYGDGHWDSPASQCAPFSRLCFLPHL